jgi:hypothetical protein
VEIEGQGLLLHKKVLPFLWMAMVAMMHRREEETKGGRMEKMTPKLEVKRMAEQQRLTSKIDGMM